MNWRTVTYLGVALSIFTGPGSLWAVQTGVWNSGMSILQFVVRSRSLVAARGVFVDCTPGTCSRAAYWVGDRPTVCLLVWCCWWEQRPGRFCSRSKCLSRGPAVFLK